MSIVFKRFSVSSFAGIDSTNPIVIDFSQLKGKRIAKATGDMGAGKTSFINALLYAAASNFDFSLDELVNTKDNAIKEDFEFEKNGKLYRIKCTKSKFELLRVIQEEDGEVLAPMKEPKSMVKELIGNIGRSPMWLKSKKGEDQVKWLYTMLDVSPDVLEEESKIKTSLAEATESRTNANREYERTKNNLEGNPLYLAWEESEEKYKEDKNSETEKKKLEEAAKKRDELTKARLELSTIDLNIKNAEENIIDLERKLAALKKGLEESQKKKEDTETFIKANEHVIVEYAAANESYMNIEKYISERKQWLEVVAKKKEMDEFQEFVIKFDSKKDELRTNLRNLTLKVLPDIKGLEVVSENSIDGKAAGVFLNEKSIVQLSESELWKFCFLLWMLKKVTMVVIENISDLGTDAIATLNELSKSGVWVWATEMKRGQKNLKIEFVEEIV